MCTRVGKQPAAQPALQPVKLLARQLDEILEARQSASGCLQVGARVFERPPNADAEAARKFAHLEY